MLRNWVSPDHLRELKDYRTDLENQNENYGVTPQQTEEEIKEPVVSESSGSGMFGGKFPMIHSQAPLTPWKQTVVYGPSHLWRVASKARPSSSCTSGQASCRMHMLRPW